MNSLIIPPSYITKVDNTSSSGSRSVTVRRFGTEHKFDQNSLELALRKCKLVLGMDVGLIKHYEYSEEEQSIRGLFGRVGDRNMALINSENGIDYIKVSHVLLSTSMIEFFRNSDETMDLLVYGSKAGANDLWELLRKNLGLQAPPYPRYFDSDRVRDLFLQYKDRLYELNFNPFEKEGYGTISSADFKGEPNKHIKASAKKMQQVIANEDIQINTFTSERLDEKIPAMSRGERVKFELRKDSGINFSVTELKIEAWVDDIEYEEIFYDFIRHVYKGIIAGNTMYQYVPRSTSGQMGLFDDLLNDGN